MASCHEETEIPSGVAADVALEQPQPLETLPSAPTTEADETLRVRYGFAGDLVLQVTPNDVEWSDDEEQFLLVDDILEILGIPQRRRCLYDLHAEGIAEPRDLHRWDSHLPLQWGQSYVLNQRTCARCTLCGRVCTRQHEGHKLCAHGGSDHLWHRPQQRDRSMPLITVQGYSKGGGADSRKFRPFPDGTLL